MKIIHLADTHLGFRQMHHLNADGRNQREQDVYDAFAQAIEQIVDLRPQAVIHAGDLFDSYHPSSAALGVALDGLRRLRDEQIPVVIIAGNHSTPRVAAAEHIFAVLERFGGVHLVYDGPRVVHLGEDQRLAVHAIPHDNEPERLAASLRDARPDEHTEFNVLVAHVGLHGLGQIVGSEAGAVTLSAEALAAASEFDYIALGHLHTLAAVRDNAAYSGSLERLSWADDAPLKGMIEVDLAADRFSATYLRPHEITGRPHIALDPIDAATLGCSLTEAIIERSRSVELAGAIVRLEVRNVSVADWNAVDHQAIATAFSSCLHFEREPQYIGATIASGQASPQLRDFLHAWLAEHSPRADAANFIARAEGFLAIADQELAS